MALEYFVIKDENNYPVEERTQDAAEADLAAPWVKVTKEELDALIADNQAAKDLADAWVALRATRDSLIDECEWMYHRHKQELEQEIDTTLTAGQYTTYLTYIQSLRDITNGLEAPGDVVWPNKPDFI